MGRIEVTDGVSTRRIRAPQLKGVVRVDLSGDPSVEVPEDVAVSRHERVGAEGVPSRRRVR